MKVNNPDGNGDVVDLYRYSGEIDSVVPGEGGPARIDISKTNKSTTTTVTTE